MLLEKTCTKCGKPFECQENDACWCFQEPLLKENEIKYDDCICKKCLLLQYGNRLIGND